MPPLDPVAEPLKENQRTIKAIQSCTSLQIRSRDLLSMLKAVGLTWFRSHRANCAQGGTPETLSSLDSDYRALVEGAEGSPTRAAVVSRLKRTRTELIKLRSQILTSSSKATATSDASPDFGGLISDPFVVQVLTSRWTECLRCISADAPVAATVMMGGLLETLLMARVNREPNKQAIFTAKAAPKDKNGKTLQLKDWTLNSYIEVAHELRWISLSARDVGVVLRDYRNYIHPYKQVSERIQLTSDDAKLLWEVFKCIARGLL